MRSIPASSSEVKGAESSAPTFSMICSGRLAPISAEVTTGSRSTHASAICASDCPRAAAISFSAAIFASLSSVMLPGFR